MLGDWGDARGEGRDTPVAAPTRRPPEPSEEERARWRALGPERFKDPAYQRYAQGFRSVESLREAGERGFQETAARHGRDFANDILARYRQDHPSDAERAMIDLLGRLGQHEGADYEREHRVVSGVYADFAWPQRKLAIEVHGSAHEAEFFLGRSMPEREERRAAAYEAAGWTVRVVTHREMQDRPEVTRERVRAILTPPEGEQRRLL